MDIGKYNTLKIARSVSFGLYLEDEDGEEVLLPTKYIPEGAEESDEIEVFVYKDSEDRLIATNLEPTIVLGEFAPLQIVSVTQAGAFADISLAKDLFIPRSEQIDHMQEGRKYLIKMILDEETDRLIGTAKMDEFYFDVPEELPVGTKVNAVVWRKSPLGYNLVLDGEYTGLLLNKDATKNLYPGDELEVTIKKVEDEKVTVALFAQGYRAIDDFSGIILKALEENEGHLELGDNSSPEEIKFLLGISKKAFKKGVGRLYKQGVIKLTEDGIELNTKAE